MKIKLLTVTENDMEFIILYKAWHGVELAKHHRA